MSMQALAIAALTAGSVAAGEIPICDDHARAISYDFGEAGHHDHGRGLVSYVWFNSFEDIYSNDLWIVGCPLRQSIRVGLSRDGFEDTASYDVTDAVWAGFEALLVAEKTYRFAEVATELRALSPDVHLLEQHDEPCACAAAYPEVTGWATAYLPPEGAE